MTPQIQILYVELRSAILTTRWGCRAGPLLRCWQAERAAAQHCLDKINTREPDWKTESNRDYSWKLNNKRFGALNWNVKWRDAVFTFEINFFKLNYTTKCDN